MTKKPDLDPSDVTSYRPISNLSVISKLFKRVTHKMATMTFKVMSSSSPAYLRDLIEMATPAQPLRSSDVRSTAGCSESENRTGSTSILGRGTTDMELTAC